jgi:hypothetical protein
MRSFPCEICGRSISRKGFARYQHGMAHVRKGEAKAGFEYGNWVFKSTTADPPAQPGEPTKEG